MKRPEQHITETKSKRLFEKIVPSEWVIREQKPDYGIDYSIEIFEKNKSTGNIFYIQLKGSTQKISDNSFKKSFSSDNLRYYDSLKVPTLIVCVSVTTGQVWGIWSNKLLYQKKLNKEQKSLSISLNEEYLLDEEKLKKITLKLDSTKKLGLSIKANFITAKLFNKNLMKWIQYYYPKTISTEFNNLPKHINLNYTLIENTNSIQLKINAYDIDKNLIIKDLKENESFLYKPIFDNNEVNDFNKNVLFSLAISFAEYDIKGSLEILLKIIDKINIVDLKELIPFKLILLAKKNNELELFNKLTIKIMELKLFDLYSSFDAAYFLIDLKEATKNRIKILKEIIKISKSKEILGICHYNLGNILRDESPLKDALKHYFNAKKLFPNYLKCDYWWSEVAGLLFLKKHYSWAEKFYKKSLDLEKNKKNYIRITKKNYPEKNLTKALVADSLFFQGKFKEANKYFEEHFISSDNISQEWILKNIICLELMNGKLNNVKIDPIKSIELCETGLYLKSNSEYLETLNQAIQLNPLNGLAWFNLGIAQNKINLFKEALFSFIVAGMINEWDFESQYNALIIAFNEQENEILQSLLIYLNEKYGEMTINKLVDFIMNQNMPLENKRNLIEVFNKIMEVINNLDLEKKNTTKKFKTNNI